MCIPRTKEPPAGERPRDVFFHADPDIVAFTEFVEPVERSVVGGAAVPVARLGHFLFFIARGVVVPQENLRFGVSGVRLRDDFFEFVHCNRF